MTSELKNLQAFIQAVQSEFWEQHPDIYQDYLGLIGRKIQDVQKEVKRLSEIAGD